MRLRINGEERVVVAPQHHTLLEVLREECGLTGTKHGCELGECGTCTVLIDGRPVLSCLALAVEVEGRAVETVEGLQIGNRLHPLQAAFADLGAAQCGYCTPGILMVARALLAANSHPSRPEIQEALAGNLCRCTGYHKILEAVEGAAAVLRGETWTPSHDTLYGAPLPAGPVAAGGREVGGGGGAAGAPGAPGPRRVHPVPAPAPIPGAGES
jgi:aerobic-type carbon monoxide dehydrogenase small subunit (CoxS/CutS family)